MFEFIFSSIKEIKKHIDIQSKIPFIYILFLISIFIFYNPNFIILIDASNWVPFNIKEILLKFVNLIYSRYHILMFIFVGASMLIRLLIETNLFKKILPKDIDYTDGTTVSWNEYAAADRLLYVSIRLSTIWWVLYFLINVIFNEHDYVKYFFVKENNPLIVVKYISENNLFLMRFLFRFNIGIVGCFIIKYLFEVETSRDNKYISRDEISMYRIINSFMHSNTLNGNSKITIIARRKYSAKPKFFLATAMNLGYTLNENNLKKQKQIHDYSYEIIDSSENLSDIIYHFNVLKDDIRANNYVVVPEKSID